MIRRTLPQRRRLATVTTDWQGHAITVGIGYYPEGTIGEVFADTAHGGHMAATVADACVVISLALQFGATVADLLKSVARVPEWRDGIAGEGMASPVGAILAAMTEGL